MRCPRCWQQINADDVYCGFCGLSKYRASAIWRIIAIVGWILVVVILLCFGFALIYWLWNGTPLATSKVPTPSEAQNFASPIPFYTALYTVTPAPLPSATQRSSFTATPLVIVVTVTQVVTVTNPKPDRYPTPALLAPLNYENIPSLEQPPTLRWLGSESLDINEYYYIEIKLANTDSIVCSLFSKASSISLSPANTGSCSKQWRFNVGSFIWRVGIVRLGEGMQIVRYLSDFSESRNFGWHY